MKDMSTEEMHKQLAQMEQAIKLGRLGYKPVIDIMRETITECYINDDQGVMDIAEMLVDNLRDELKRRTVSN